ncbi:MAG TPA: hypothetical protein VM818_10390 [Vicinamibacterales bacterium]|nr:hypothetical protein [Vicinamibacterales bacterium]
MSRPLTVFEDRESHRWGMVTAAPHRSVRPHVRRYVGWWEHRTTPLHRPELPSAEVPLIISFGAPIRLFEVADHTKSTELGSFATGAYDAHVGVRRMARRAASRSISRSSACGCSSAGRSQI